MGNLFGKKKQKGGRGGNANASQANLSLKEKADSMQEVVTNIFMGPATVSKDLELLQSKGITHILAIGWDLQAYFPEQFDYCVINKVEDRPGYLLIQHFAECFAFMDKCLNANVINRKSTLIRDVSTVGVLNVDGKGGKKQR